MRKEKENINAIICFSSESILNERSHPYSAPERSDLCP